jgi:hypothetical protein
VIKHNGAAIETLRMVNTCALLLHIRSSSFHNQSVPSVVAFAKLEVSMLHINRAYMSYFTH